MQPNLKQAKKAAVRALLRPDSPGNVVGVGIGKKSGADCLRIYVVRKLAPNRLSEKALVPGDFLRVPTDVIEIGPLGRKGREPWAEPAPTPGPGSRIRVETRAPNVNSGAIGTLGGVVELDGSGQQYILSCNHILAANGRVPGDPAAKVVWAAFVGKETTLAGPVLHSVGDKQISVSPVVYVPLRRHGENLVDCALAQIKNRTNLPAEFPKSMALNPDPIEPKIHMKVQKSGAATDHTMGTIIDTSTDLYVDTSFGRFRFNDQIVIETRKDPEFATEGDSGSIVWDEKSKQPVAMVFAATGGFAIACRLSEVLSGLEKELKTKLQDDPKRLVQMGHADEVKLSLRIR
jgi:hypothetical protein